MQENVGAARGRADRRVVERVDLDYLGAGWRAFAAPGRTRLVTVQPASRKASAAAWPNRPAAPRTRMRRS